jgi:hypothetical protein
MHQTTIYVDPTGAAPMGFAQAAGMPGDVKFDFKTQSNLAYPGIADLYPQMVLKPFTLSTFYAYDIEINDPVGASGIATIPGGIINDRYGVEVYTRNAAGQPQRMLACGRIDLTGSAYMTTGPLGPAAYPQGSIGPPGPTGPAGAAGAPGAPGDPGMRGSRWYTAAGPPVGVIPDERVPGDMYLDESNGDVWRWDGVAWVAFRGV